MDDDDDDDDDDDEVSMFQKEHTHELKQLQALYPGDISELWTKT